MKYIIQTLLLFLLIGFNAGCVSDAEILPKEYPYITTEEATEIDSSGITLNAIIHHLGKEEILDYGFIMIQNSGVNYGPNKTSETNTNKSGENKFVFSLKGKTPINNFSKRIFSGFGKNVSYTYRAYIQTDKTFYSANPVEFTSVESKTAQITDLFPKSGFDGTRVTLKGKNFSDIPQFNRVYVNGKQVELISFSPDSIAFNMPKTEYIGNATIALKIGSNDNALFTWFKIIGPEIKSISSTADYSGKYLDIEGQNFLKNGDNLEVYFDENKAEIADSSDSKIKVLIPPLKYYPFINNETHISIINGSKKVTFGQAFTVKKSWTWKEKSYPFYYIYTYQAFPYNNEGYIFAYNTKIFYKYSPASNQWNRMSSTIFPGNPGNGCLFITSGSKVYKVGGKSINGEAINELWCFDFSNNQWQQKNNLPFRFTDATFFNQNDQVYILTNDRQLWKCNFENEKYERLKDFPGNVATGFISSFNCDMNTYVVTYGTTWQYSYAQDSWIEKAKNPFTKINTVADAIAFSYNNTGYVVSYELVYKYSPTSDKWIFTSFYPSGSGNTLRKTSFVIGNSAYIVGTYSSESSSFEDVLVEYSEK